MRSTPVRWSTGHRTTRGAPQYGRQAVHQHRKIGPHPQTAGPAALRVQGGGAGQEAGDEPVLGLPDPPGAEGQATW
ncbi:MAG: hypothetical protein MZV70_22080 [Desulfobacterales bacterium]|nr:hypothetical protein [Desulfobacterales bacterium]